jgi:hypothetical protein
MIVKKGRALSAARFKSRRVAGIQKKARPNRRLQLAKSTTGTSEITP